MLDVKSPRLHGHPARHRRERARGPAWKEQWRASRVGSYSNGAAELTVRLAFRFAPLYEAEMVTVVEKTTRLVLTVKVALVAPAGTVTLAGTVATDGLLLESATTAPPAAAGPLSVTVPVEDPSGPPITLVGLRLSEERVAAITVSEAVCVAPP